jgi:hypothetical protein
MAMTIEGSMPLCGSASTSKLASGLAGDRLGIWFGFVTKIAVSRVIGSEQITFGGIGVKSKEIAFTALAGIRLIGRTWVWNRWD